MVPPRNDSSRLAMRLLFVSLSKIRETNRAFAKATDDLWSAC